MNFAFIAIENKVAEPRIQHARRHLESFRLCCKTGLQWLCVAFACLLMWLACIGSVHAAGDPATGQGL